MTTCKICGSPFDPAQQNDQEPAVAAGVFCARELYGDDGQLCPRCLASRGELAMMYLREFD